MKAAETALVANAAVNGLFATNLPTFLTGRGIGGGFGDNGLNNSWEITLPELGNALMGGKGGVADSAKWQGEGGVMGMMKKNISQRGFDSLVQMALIPVGFRIARKVLSKPLLNPTNRALKSMGVTEVKL